MPVRASGAPPTVAVSLTSQSLTESDADTLVVPSPAEDDGWSEAVTALDGALDGQLTAALKDADFKGTAGTTRVIPTLGRLNTKRIIVTGLPGGATAEDMRRAYGSAASAAKRAGAVNVAAAPPAGGSDVTSSLRAATEGALLALYTFETYRSGKQDANEGIASWTFTGDESEAAQEGVRQGVSLASGVYLARDMVFEPGNVIYPESLAEIAREMSTNVELEYEVFNEVQLAEMGAGAIVAVGRGSEHLPRLVRMTYAPSGESKGTIALVGKGITFDTGGMSLKSGEGMVPMKTDMAGGAAVLGAMRAIAELDLPFTVHGIISAAENTPSDTAYRPSDVLTAMNGKTIEVISTDAEGRLVLADALVYAARLGAEEMIDLATLTGAKVVALGAESVAVFSNDDELAAELLAASDEAGEQWWRLPLWDSMRKQLDSEIADMKNTGGRGGGSITAALFLSEFSEGKKWAHLDIAGAAWASSASGYTPKGASGVAVRALVNYLEAKASA